MRVAELTAFHVRIPLKKPVRHASHTRDINETVIVRCQLDSGVVGWGEGLPRPYVTGETIETVFEQLAACNLPAALGESFDDLASVIRLCDKFELPRPADKRDCFGNAARCAVELAILDAATRAMEVPLSEVTRKLPETIGIRQDVPQVRYSGAITTTSPWKEWLRAKLFRWAGFQQCKVKVGTEGHDDVATLRRVRSAVGPKMDLRLDANEAWSSANLEEKLTPLLPFQVTSLEQPVPHAEVDGLAALRPKLAVPLMLDESLCSLGDARRAIERSTCDLFNIRLSKCGGMLPSLRIAALAHQAGLGYQLGCQVGETGILSAAGRHFATSVANIRYLEGSFDRFLVRERLTHEDLTFGLGGVAPALRGPGLGVQIDERAIARVKIAKEQWSF